MLVLLNMVHQCLCLRLGAKYTLISTKCYCILVLVGLSQVTIVRSIDEKLWDSSGIIRTKNKYWNRMVMAKSLHIPLPIKLIFVCEIGFLRTMSGRSTIPILVLILVQHWSATTMTTLPTNLPITSFPMTHYFPVHIFFLFCFHDALPLLMALKVLHSDNETLNDDKHTNDDDP